MNTYTLEATIVGEAFIPGPKMNAELKSLLKLDDEPAPDFCNRTDLSAEYMEFENHVPYIKPTLDKKHVCIFDHDGAVHITKPFRKGSQALACALYFVLIHKSLVT